MGPLSGLRVIDLTRVVSGPYCTMTLGDMGAEVIKIEKPGDGDEARGFAPPYQGDQSAYFLSVNRNKKGMTLDLKHPQGKDILWRLIESADILVENFRPGVMDRLGFSYNQVQARKPDLIYASISGFGATGIAKDRPGYDVIVQGEAGIMDITGDANGPPQKVGTSIADLVTGLTTTNAILGALHFRNISGQGQHVDVSMFEATAALLTFNAGMYFATGEAPTRRGNAHPSIVPYEAFEASDGWFNLAVANNAHWQKCCTVMGRDDLANDDRFQLAPDRVTNRDVLLPILRERLREEHREHWIEAFQEAGIPAAPIRTIDEVCEGEVLASRHMVAEMPHVSAGPVRTIKSPMHLSETSMNDYVAPPVLGEHTEDILSQLLGFDGDEISKLRTDNVI